MAHMGFSTEPNILLFFSCILFPFDSERGKKNIGLSLFLISIFLRIMFGTSSIDFRLGPNTIFALEGFGICILFNIYDLLFIKTSAVFFWKSSFVSTCIHLPLPISSGSIGISIKFFLSDNPLITKEELFLSRPM